MFILPLTGVNVDYHLHYIDSIISVNLNQSNKYKDNIFMTQEGFQATAERFVGAR